jgi:hypothetical protein
MFFSLPPAKAAPTIGSNTHELLPTAVPTLTPTLAPLTTTKESQQLKA